MKIIVIIFGILIASQASAGATDAEKMFYREMILKMRTEATFKIPMADHGDLVYRYKAVMDTPLWPLPKSADTPSNDVEETWKINILATTTEKQDSKPFTVSCQPL